MKKLLALISIMAMALGMITVAAAAEPSDIWPDEVIRDTSVFFVEPHDEVACVCGLDMGVRHMVNRGVTFFEWIGFMEKCRRR